VSGSVAATAWSAGAALLSSYLITGTAAAEAKYGCMCVERTEPAPPPPSPPSAPTPRATSYYTVSTTSDAPYKGWKDYNKYKGAATLGTKVYLAPSNQNNVGVINTITKVFTSIATTGDAASGDSKYDGAAAVGNKVRRCKLNR